MKTVSFRAAFRFPAGETSLTKLIGRQDLTVLSSMFLHAGILHYVGNMFFLWMFGYRIENTFGAWLFAFVYLLCGFGASGLHYLINSTSTIPCVGASGAISGIMGCYFV